MSIANLFFRPFDKARLDRLVDAINKEMLSAALISDSEGLLDHYGRILVKKLREIGNLEVEVYYPNSTEALLNRFNKILEDISIDSAVTSKKSTAPHKVLVAFDSQATGLREVQLMARLVKDFPGAHTRVILMLDKNSSTQYEKKIEAFGNSIIRWDIATPTKHEVSVLLSEAELTGMQPEVRQALANVGVSLDAKLALAASNRAINRAEETLNSPEKKTITEESNNPDVNLNIKEDKNHEKSSVENTQNASSVDDSKKENKVTENHPNIVEKNNKKNSERMKVFLAATSFLFISGIIISWVNQTNSLSIEKITEEIRLVFLKSERVDELQKNKLENEKTTEEIDLTKSPNTDDSNPSSNQETLSKTLNNINTNLLDNIKLTEKNEEIVEIISSDKEVESFSSEEEIKEKSREEQISIKEKPLVTNKIEPGFYVQHTARPSKAIVTNIKSRFPSLQNSKIFKLKKTRSDDFFYVLLSGPFSTLNQAKEFANREDIPEGTWIRGALSIRPLIVPLD